MSQSEVLTAVPFHSCVEHYMYTIVDISGSEIKKCNRKIEQKVVWYVHKLIYKELDTNKFTSKWSCTAKWKAHLFF